MGLKLGIGWMPPQLSREVYEALGLRVVLTEAGLRFIEAGVERAREVEDALAERMGGQERLEELAESLEELMALSAEPIPTRPGSAGKP